VLRGLEGDPVVKVAPLPSAETLYACTSLNPQGTPLGPRNQLHLCCQSNNRPGVQLCCQPANLLYPLDISSVEVLLLPLPASISYPIAPDDDDDLHPTQSLPPPFPPTSHIRLTCPRISSTSDNDDKNIIQFTEHQIVYASTRLQHQYRIPPPISPKPLIPQTPFHSSLPTSILHSYTGRFE
jgi:hypothetical protein